MRILPTALVASAVIHGGAIAWALAHKIEAPKVVSEPTTVEIFVAGPDPTPIDVALLDRHTVVPDPVAVEPHESPVTVRHPARAQTSQISTATTKPPPELPPAAAAPHSPFMGMRDHDKKPEPTGLSGSFVDDFLAHSKPLQPKSIASEQIHDDLANGEDHLHDPRWIANHSSEDVAAERQRTLIARQDRDGHEIQQKGTGYAANHAVFNGQIEADGTAHIEKKRRYDPTEIIMNRHNIDPYASNKLRMLDDTREERYEIGKAYKKKQLANSAVIAQKNLAYLSARTTDPKERKEALFEMWDECAETGSAELVAGGTAARTMIVGFIKGRMTGPFAYSTAELAAFNAKKKSSETFAPYAD